MNAIPSKTPSTLFRLIARMRTPVIFDGVLPLDSLLAAAVFESTGKMGAEAMELVPIDRQQVDGESIALASGAFVESGAKLESTTIIRRIVRDEMGPEFYAGKKRKAGLDPWKIIQDRDDLKALMREYTQTTTKSLSWIVWGDAEGCAGLLESLMFIGKRRGQGFGQIDHVETRQLPATSAPLSPWIGALGQPLRSIPWPLWEKIGGGPSANRNMVPCRHPTWASTPELCAVPSRRAMVWDPVAEAKASVVFI